MAKTKKRDRTGRKQRHSSPSGKIRRENVRKFYDARWRNIVPGDFEFSLRLLRGRGQRAITLDKVVESFDWTDEQAVLTGNVTLHRPDPKAFSSLPIAKGHRIRCYVRWGSRKNWVSLWTMRCSTPDPVLDPTGTLVTVELKDDLDLLRRNRRDWTFRKTKRRKVGHFPHQIAVAVARREGIKLGRIAKGTKRIDKLVKKDASALDVLRAAYKHERDATGRRFVIRLTNGKLEILPYQRNRVLYIFARQITHAAPTEEEKDIPVTVLEGKAHIGKGKHANKVRHTELRRSVVDRFGYIHKTQDYGRVKSLSELRTKVKRDYAKQIKTTRIASLSTPGVPFIRRGDGCQWLTPEPGWHGRSEGSLERSFVYVRRISHQVDSGGYTTDIDIVQEDPFAKDKERRDKERRERKRKARKKRRRGQHG